MTRPSSVSVVIPARDPGRFLHHAVDSVVAQTHDDWDLVVVDDGSTEDLAWVAEVDPRVRLVRTPAIGVSHARNLGIAETGAALVAFLDADDRWHPRKLERQLAAMADGTPFCHTAFDLIDEGGERIGPGYGERVDYLDMLGGRLGILQSSMVVRRDALLAAGLYNPMLSLQEDLDLFLRLAYAARGVFVDSVEVDYRQHPASASSSYWDAMWALLHLYDEHEASARRNGDAAALAAVRTGRRAVRFTYGCKAIDAARTSLHARDWTTGSLALAHAVRASPRAVARSGKTWVRTRLDAGEPQQR
ncbi:MAG TPA: glycosyltransferase family A protein [Acidimicrobiia bacterium]